jgi:hypothetical protein
MTDRCEPPEHLRGVDGWHWVARTKTHHAIIRWHRGAWVAASEELIGPARAAQSGWRYLAPVAPPDLVRELVEALEEARNELCVYEDAATGEHYNNTKINAALARAKEAGV